MMRREIMRQKASRQSSANCTAGKLLILLFTGNIKLLQLTSSKLEINLSAE